jgi:hypothetical protein
MAGAFETATRAAIQDLIENHAQPSKFGYILSHEAFKELTTDLYNLLVTSRNLKAQGDRFLATGGAPAQRPSGAPGRGPKR